MPDALTNLTTELERIDWQDLVWSIGCVVVAALAGAIVAALVFRAIARWAKHTETVVDDKVALHLQRPLRWLLPLIAIRLALPLVELTDDVDAFLEHLSLILVIVCAGWLALRAVRMLEEIVNYKFDLQAKDNLAARSVQTQMRGLRNLAGFVIVVLTIGFALMTFDEVRKFGVSLLASAGVAGIVIGFAAQKSIATVVAGIQIAITQPIRVDDVVIVEGEWGRIEEIRLTYVVVRIWDLRRLIVPVNYFIETPFQNWTRDSAEILGTVFLYADYTVPVDDVRAELQRILEDSRDLWDGKVSGLVVTNNDGRTVELRALMSAADSGKAWDLRCRVRERLITWMQHHHPNALPRFRAELDRSEPRAA